jgi:hypothetical protein
MNLWGDDPTLIDNKSGVPPTDEFNLTNQVLVSGALIGHSQVPSWYDSIVVQLHLIFPGYPLPDASVMADTLQSPATITQDTNGSDTSNGAKPTDSLIIQPKPSPDPPTVQPIGSTEGIGAPSQPSFPTAVSLAAPSSSSAQPAQSLLTTQVEVGSFSRLPSKRRIPNHSVALKVARQTKTVKVQARAKVPQNRTHPSPRIRVKAIAISSQWRLSHDGL